MWALWIYRNGWIDILNKTNNLTWNYEDDTCVELSFDSMYDLSKDIVVYFYKDNKEIYRGVLVKRHDKKYTYSYTALDYIWYLNKNEEVRQFNDISATSAITQLLNAVDISCNIVNINTKINKIYKDQTITSIIDDILEQSTQETGINYCRYMDNNIFTISKVQDLKIYPKFIIGDDLSISSSIEDLKNSIIVTSSESENMNILASAKDEKSINSLGRLQEIITVEEKDYSQASNIASKALDRGNKIKKEMNINIIALEKGEEIKSNRLIYLDIKEKNIKGWYRIKSANHSLSNGLHKVGLTFEYFEEVI